jgi:hypothetical protein
MKTTLLSLVLFSFLCFTTDTDAQEEAHRYSKKGIWETGGELFFTTYQEKHSVDGTGYLYPDSKYTNFMLSIDAGYFVINGLKLGLEQDLEADDIWGHTRTRIKFYFTPEYVFDTKTILYPYIAVSAGYTLNTYQSSTAQDGFSWGVKGGVKVNITGNSLLNIGLRYYEENYNYNYEYFGAPSTNYSYKDKMKNLGLSLGWSVFF